MARYNVVEEPCVCVYCEVKTDNLLVIWLAGVQLRSPMSLKIVNGWI
jgi:hypothetical protein